MLLIKLRPYFLEHRIFVLTSYPLKQIMHRPDVSVRMIKWAVELSQFDLTFEPRTSMKGQILADFIAEFTSPITKFEEPSQEWSLYVDESSTSDRAGVGIVLVSPDQRLFCSAVRLGFPATNNDAEYEALLAGLEMACRPHTSITQ
ncbi:hypothetical protein OROGR_002078 [Orobanche gracilis]